MWEKLISCFVSIVPITKKYMLALDSDIFDCRKYGNGSRMKLARSAFVNLCRTVAATFLQMESDTDTYKNSYDCPRCSEKMPSMPIDEELDHGLALACPDCGKKKLSVECFLHWD
ncbi:hypothetical protein AA984_00285 [Brevibacillus formosus]|uniref:Uncharacterized protein n=1 Tax=Brevibacillus formosus TaxID=54913 RepID=A0A837KVQ2_9BACL|nr:hypothetical protein AA984_00285 [Brevibacillus formosus]PSJ99202.1 hypothetical protein C7R91_04585 [Brevibacillus formosus]